jgi:Protein of unknown function (DUF2510)
MSAPTDVLPGAGWYRDPSNPGTARWWDGTGWTTQTQNLPQPPAPVAQPAAELPAAAVAPPSALALPPPAPAAPDAELPPAFGPPGLGGPAFPPGFLTDETAAGPGLIGIAEPVLPSSEGDEPAPKARFKLPFSMPSSIPFLSRGKSKAAVERETSKSTSATKVSGSRFSSLSLPSMPGNPLVALLLVLVLAGGGWYAWSHFHTSSAPAAGPVPTHVVVPTPAKAKPLTVKLPTSAPSELAGIPWDVHAQSRSKAAHAAATQRAGGHRVIASFYGDSGTERYFFLGSTLVAADRKAVSNTVERTRLTALMNSALGTKATKVAFVRVAASGASPLPVACVSGRSGSATVSLCSWQNTSTRVVVAKVDTIAAVQATMRSVLTDLS